MKFTTDIIHGHRLPEQLHILSEAVKQTASVIVITNAQGAIEYVNPSFEKLTGYKACEVQGQNPSILKSGDVPLQVYQEMWETITAGGEWRGQFHNKRKNGELFWEAACISAICNREGTITHFLAVKEDITHKIVAHEAREKAHVKIRKDLLLAGKIQQDFLPAELRTNLFQVKTIYHPAHYVSGDFLEYKWDEERQVLLGCVVDVMGHGLAAALQTSALRVLIRQVEDSVDAGNLAKKMARINQQTLAYFAEDSFAAAICFEINFTCRKLDYCAGGINYFLHLSQRGVTVMKAPGTFLGMIPDALYEEDSMAFHSGDSFFFLSDGLFDAFTEQADHWQTDFQSMYECLLALVQECRDDASAICIYIAK